MEIDNKGDANFIRPLTAELKFPNSNRGELPPLDEGAGDVLVESEWKPGEGIPMRKPEPFNLETDWWHL